ncbi:ABC transporter ATP-binding protein [Mucilaginibacter flavidus]|uniref:ABC transporter ATP-binding protein n=1 Tax=Mucilaginibacter flavidus TaxID=2949309 RepID=UPI002092DEFE|nr:polysaccharide ABC transporter ATP-binding protein [Mucilaginibacter flavidus]MCO5947658.1 polysaccharide ABC transporter ATP-binding protein [Mucilaginibacter flavidus]
MPTVIKAENLSKAYQLGEIGTGTISRDLERFWARVRGKEDPFLKIGEENDRSIKGKSDVVWSLKDLNFDIEQGDAVGIIGRNGAGKSTLLKILSRVTAPTAGSVKVKGRIASLLEVGTGFHPELSGKENIYLNGAILGMRKAEIKRKFDEIVDFSGVGRYIDTPVKRYSSGMYVRLAFAVAAHLESEILIVDEVLAVGDAEFQKKCLGKMNDVSKGEGRTVLFVSHNMDAIMRLCSHAILLKNGCLTGYSQTDKIIDHYLRADFGTTAIRKWEGKHIPGDGTVRLLEVFVHDESFKPEENFEITGKIGITIKYEVLKSGCVFTHGMNLFNSQGVNILNSHDVTSASRKQPRKIGKYSSTMWIPGNFLSEGTVIAGVAIFNPEPFYLHFQEADAIAFNVFDNLNPESARGNYVGGFPGIVRPILQWNTSSI